jgi:hypothetical protein
MAAGILARCPLLVIPLARRPSFGGRVLAWLGPLAPWAHSGALRQTPTATAAVPEGHRSVRPLPVAVRKPHSLAERSALAALNRRGPLPFGTLLQCVARDLYLDELRRGGWVADIGVLGPTLFASDAAREIEAAAGALWEIEPSPGAPADPSAAVATS